MRLVDAIQRHRDEYCLAIWAAGFGIALWREAPAANLARLDPMGPALGAWALVLAGVLLRIWAAANLEKNRFTRPVGPYLLMRHPLYAGTLLISLGWFLSLGMPLTGLALWLAMLGGIFLPVLRKEERELAARFPAAYGKFLREVPALRPRLGSLGAALRSSAFTAERAGRNFGLRALWFLLIVPVLSEALAWALGR